MVQTSIARWSGPQVLGIANNLDSSIHFVFKNFARCIVYHKNFKIGMGLFQNRLQTSLKFLQSVVGGDDDGNQRVFASHGGKLLTKSKIGKKWELNRRMLYSR